MLKQLQAVIFSLPSLYEMNIICWSIDIPIQSGWWNEKNHRVGR